MENVQVIYKELFSIKFSHAGLDPTGPSFISDLLVLEPDAATRTLFTSYSMRTRFDNDVFTCFIRCRLFLPAPVNQHPKIAFTGVADNTRLRFSLNATNRFFSKTDIGHTGPAQVYYFNNRVNATTATLRISQGAGMVDAADLKSATLVLQENASLGLVDIYTSGAANGDYELFNTPDRILRSPGYTIAFKNKN